MEPVVDARVECSDIDRDGVCDEDDRCEGFDDSLDRDGDAVPDFCDQCPDDPLKSEMGQCGCGVEDQDVDGDELADCRDACPIDGPSVAPTFGGVVTEEAMQILASQWMVVPGEGASIPSNPVPTVVASERLRLRVSYQVTGAPCLSCVKQGEVGIEEVDSRCFDRVAAIDFRGVKDLDFVAPAVPRTSSSPTMVSACYAEDCLALQSSTPGMRERRPLGLSGSQRFASGLECLSSCEMP